MDTRLDFRITSLLSIFKKEHDENYNPNEKTGKSYTHRFPACQFAIYKLLTFPHAIACFGGAGIFLQGSAAYFAWHFVANTLTKSVILKCLYRDYSHYEYSMC